MGLEAVLKWCFLLPRQEVGKDFACKFWGKPLKYSVPQRQGPSWSESYSLTVCGLVGQMICQSLSFHNKNLP